MSMTDYLENELLDHVLGGGGGRAYTPPATIYVGLFTTAPNDAGGGTEVSGGSYARVAVPFATVASGGSISNSSAATFPTASASWGTVTHFALFDAISGGNQLYNNSLTASKTIGSGDTASFAIGQLTVTQD